jgi:excisionase family DNA binding protein
METTFSPDSNDVLIADALLAATSQGILPETPKLVGTDGLAIELSPMMAKVLRRIAEDWSTHRAISIVSHETKLTTQQAAEFIGVSRPTLIKLLDEHRVPLELVGRHRKIAFEDLRILRDQLRTKRFKAIHEMRRIAESAGEYDFDYSDNPLIRE